MSDDESADSFGGVGDRAGVTVAVWVAHASDARERRGTIYAVCMFDAVRILRVLTLVAFGGSLRRVAACDRRSERLHSRANALRSALATCTLRITPTPSYDIDHIRALQLGE